MKTAVRPQPCLACPYRLDCPSGVWAHEEYEKLRRYDAPTWAQPTNGFSCHASPDHYCHGWAVVHSSRGHEFELLALRIHWPGDGVPTSTVPLFASGDAAADHGQAEMATPSADAVEVMQRLVRKYPHIAQGVDGE